MFYSAMIGYPNPIPYFPGTAGDEDSVQKNGIHIRKQRHLQNLSNVRSIESKALKAYRLGGHIRKFNNREFLEILGYSSARLSGYFCAMPRVRTQNAIRNADPGLAGFSLVEILVVVMVILIIAAIAIPNLVHGKMRANEAAAVSSVKTINTARMMYNDAFREVGYASSLANLGAHGSSCEKPTSTNACLIMDEALTSGLKSGYIFEIVGDGNKPTIGYTVTHRRKRASQAAAMSLPTNAEKSAYSPRRPWPIRRR